LKSGLSEYWPVIDGHADTLVQSAIEGRSFFCRSECGHLDLERLLVAGVDLQILSICAGRRDDPYQFALDMLTKWERDYAFFQESSPLNSCFIIVKNKADFMEWRKQRKVGVILGLEGLEPLEGKIDRLEEFYQRGIRLFSLTWNLRNQFAFGVGCDTDQGLTELGKKLVTYAEQMGFFLDLAHLGYKGFFDLMELAKRPVIVSHANMFAVYPHKRNLKKEQVQAIAETGGVIGLTFYPPFIGRGRVGLEDLWPHLDYLLEKWGDRLPALGGDFDGIDSTPYNLVDVLGLEKLVVFLESRGVKRQARAGFLGGNLYRVLKGVFLGDEC